MMYGLGKWKIWENLGFLREFLTVLGAFYRKCKINSSQ